MKNGKKIFGVTAVSIFVVVILITNVTAMPMTYNNIIEKKEQTSSIDIITQALKYCNDPTVNQTMAEKKMDLINLIDTYPIEYRQALKNFFNVDDVFNLSKTIAKINTINPNNAISDIEKKFMKAPDNSEQFNEINEENVGELLSLMSINGFDDPQIFCPICEFICLIILAISYIWVVPLSVLGDIGLFIADLITCIIFSPIIIPMGIYLGFVGCYQNEPEYRAEVNLINFVPLTLEYLFFENWLTEGFIHVLEICLYETWDWTVEGYTYTTGETAPIAYYYMDIDQVTKWVTFMIDVEDTDILQYENNEPKPRDYVQVGWDLNGDKDPDEWTPLYEQTTNPVSIVKMQRFDSGNHVVYAFLRDNLGVQSEPIKFEFTMTNDMDAPKDYQSGQSNQQQSTSSQQSTTPTSAATTTTATSTSTSTTTTTVTTSTSTPATTTTTTTSTATTSKSISLLASR